MLKVAIDQQEYLRLKSLGYKVEEETTYYFMPDAEKGKSKYKYKRKPSTLLVRTEVIYDEEDGPDLGTFFKVVRPLCKTPVKSGDLARATEKALASLNVKKFTPAQISYYIGRLIEKGYVRVAS